jgi:hypothetical protein
VSRRRRGRVRSGGNDAFVVEPRYSKAQREAIAAAYHPWRCSASSVVAMAAQGALRHPDGARLAAFTATASSVRSIARRARLREQAEVAERPACDLHPRDAVERFRIELSNVLEREIGGLEHEQAVGRPVSFEALRQAIRATRELAWIPERHDPTPPAPGAKVAGVRHGSETRGGIAGRVLAGTLDA